MFYFGENRTELTPCIQFVLFLEFLFCSFRRGRAEKGPFQGAALGLPHLGAPPEVGRTASRRPAVGLVEAAALLGLHPFSCLHYFFL